MAKQKTSKGATETASAFDPISQLQRAGFGNMVVAQAAWLESLGDIGAEVATFVAERIKEDVDTQHQILQCKDMDEVRRIQRDFLQTAVDQYQAETGKLAQMSMDAFKVKEDPLS